MDTPPNTGTARPNFMQFLRGDMEDDNNHHNEMMMKFGTKYSQLYKRELPMNTEAEHVSKMMNDMKKHASFLDITKWMFENNSMLHCENYSGNAL